MARKSIRRPARKSIRKSIRRNSSKRSGGGRKTRSIRRQRGGGECWQKERGELCGSTVTGSEFPGTCDGRGNCKYQS